MPLITFINLEPSRQKEILDVAFEEFALYPYETASLSRIVKNLSVAKGSFYRYFENKLDLYKYLVELATKMKTDLVKKELKAPINNIVDLFNEDFLLKLYFDLEYPIYSGFLYNVMQERNNEELGNITLETKKKMMDDIKAVLVAQQAEGTLKSTINLDVIAYTIVQIQIGIYDYLEIKYKINFRENILNKKPVFAIPASEIMLTIKAFTGLIHEGVSKAPHQ
ncbi:MAG: TetR/AcrR family transcriptional regulator [Bacteroidota bacterium]|nr:TetR/AcrR family transcriptional regulator [Bacteroidota bacterium]